MIYIQNESKIKSNQQIMKKDKQPGSSKSIDQFEFHILPISISSSKSLNAFFFIYFQKGAQVIGKIDQPISPSTKKFRFDQTHIKRFRAANDKNLSYHWSLYRITSQDEEEYVQSIPFNIKNQFEQYIKQFDKIQNDLYRIFHEKEKKSEIQEIWKDLRHDLKSQLQFTTVFNKLNIKLVFKIKINCEYDFRYEKWEQLKQKRKNQKKTSITREASSQSKNSVFKTPSQNSLNEQKQKTFDSITASSKAPQQIKGQNINKPIHIIKVRNTQETDELNESEKIITNPQGVEVMADIPEKFLNHRKALDDQFYYREKTSMLSDILQQSYEGSSNANLMKSNQGQRLKSVEIIHEQEEPMFSPMIKTQTFESQKHEAYFKQIKRTATLAQKHSQQIELEQTPKKVNKKTNQSPKNSGVLVQGYDYKNQKITMSVTPKMKTSGRQTLQIEEQQKQSEVDYSEAKKLIIKNSIKVFMIVILLVVVVSVFSIFDRRLVESQSESKPHKNWKDFPRRQHQIEKTTKSKHSKPKF